ncbi:MAG: hypothetical protein ACOC16_01890 [Nanoarchaeota archaeon]
MNESFNNIVNSSINQTINDSISQVPLFLGISAPLTMSPLLDILIIAFIGSAFVTIINKYLSDQVKIRALRAEMKDLKKKSRKYMVKDPQKAQAIQQEMMKKSFESMKHAMNPKVLIITMIPMLLLIGLVKNLYSPFGDILNLGFVQFAWLGTYIVFSIIWSIALKKLLDVA